MIDLQELKALAEACGDDFYCDEPYREDRKYSRVEVNSLEFSAAATPTVVLGLIAELESARKAGLPDGEILRQAAFLLDAIDRRKADRANRLGLLCDTPQLIDEEALRDLSSSACQSALSEGINEEAFTRLARSVEKKCRDKLASMIKVDEIGQAEYGADDSVTVGDFKFIL